MIYLSLFVLLIAVLVLWRAMALVAAARKALDDAREQTNVTRLMTDAALLDTEDIASELEAAVEAALNNVNATADALDERETRIVEQVATMRVELSEVQQKVEPLTKLIR